MSSIQQTLGFLKPDAINKKEELLTLIKANHSQWKITFEQELILSVGEAKTLYPKEAEALWLSSRPIYVFILEGNNVINNWLEFVGPMNPLKAKQSSPQSLRALYGVNSLNNVCHASESEEKAYQDLIWLQGLVLEDLKIKKPILSTKKSPSTSSSMENKNNNDTKKELKKPTKLKKPSNVPSKISKPNTSSSNDNALPTSKTSSTSSISSTNSNPTTTLKKKSNIALPKSSTITSPSSSALKNTKQKSNLIPPSTTPSKVSQSKYDRMKPRTSRIASSSATKDISSSSNGKKATDNKSNVNTSSLPTGSSNSNNNKRISSTGGISKNIPAKSVLTGRPRKYSRAKKEDVPSNLISSEPIKEESLSSIKANEKEKELSAPLENKLEEEKEEEEKEKIEEEKEKEEAIENVSPTVPETVINNHHNVQQQEEEKEKEDQFVVKVEKEEEEEKVKLVEGSISSSSTAANTDPIEPLPSITSTTVCSQATNESDHDAEVAATTSKFIDNNSNNSNDNKTTTTTTSSHVKSMAASIVTTGLNTIKSNPVESPTAAAIRRLSNTSSAASTLPRPETPEVDNIRQKFESMSQLNNNNNNTTPIMPTKRNSINPEVASRIKDMKPRDPVGNRVKSMVEFFMDENLHKWEF